MELRALLNVKKLGSRLWPTRLRNGSLYRTDSWCRRSNCLALVDADIGFAVERMVTVFIIACPHALGLAVPFGGAFDFVGSAKRTSGQTASSLGSCGKIDVVMMDKTGTLTAGSFTVNAVHSNDENLSDDEALALMAAVEMTSSHPLAVGILEKAEELDLELPRASDVQNLPGVGIGGTVGGRDVKVVSAAYLRRNDIAFDEEQYVALSSEGNSVSFLLVDEVNSGIVAQGDQIKPDAKEMIDKLCFGITPIMLTGDNKQSAAVGRKV